jgi:serine phosphatase RsbU (regulator of sigma subunit)
MNRPSPAHVFAWAAPFGIFANHIFLCFFLPWSFEQSVRPAMIILPVATAISLGDLLIGNTGLTSLLTPVLVVMAFVPGSVWCWWRFSKFRSGFKMYYESSAFQQLQLELGNARRIHESQLPAVRSTGPLQMYYAYEPMRQIGGDLLFSFPPADIATDKLTAVVLDVTGHGVAAALFVNRLVGELERCFGENPDATPDDVLAALNGHVFYTLAKHSMYATAIAAQIDLTQNTLTYASAGHPDAFLRFANMPCERLVSTACMLGVIDPKSYDGQQVTRPFETGSSVVLYTDGAMEARNHETGKSLGMEGLQSIMQSLTPGLCSAWPQQVLSQVTVHRQAPPDDDTLIVALCRV